MVRTWQPERDRRLVLVLDTSRTSAGRVGDVPRLDAAMDAALLLAALAARAGDRVDLLAGDRRVRARVVGASRSPLLGDLVDARWPRWSPRWWRRTGRCWRARCGTMSRQRSLVVLFTPLEPAAVEESLLPTLADADPSPPGGAGVRARTPRCRR